MYHQPLSPQHRTVEGLLASAHLRVLLHLSWAALPVAAVNLVLLAAVLFGHIPWWLALPVPALTALRCVYYMMRLRVIDPAQTPFEKVPKLLRYRSKATLITTAVLSAWAFMVIVLSPPMIGHAVAAAMGFTAVGALTYAAYPQRPMQLILAIFALPMVAAFLYRADFMGLMIAATFASNTFLLQRYFSGSASNLRRHVVNEFEAEQRILHAKRAQHEIARIANTDELTGIANRRAFLHTANVLIRERQAQGAPFAIGVFDLDGFKPVNDCYGHSVGDDVLKEVARRLCQHFSSECSVARLGGDEFAVLIKQAPEPWRVKQMGNDAITMLSAPINVDGNVAQISASAGFAIFPEAGTSAATLLERADEALYLVKRNGRGSTSVYDVATQRMVLRHAELEQRLRRAIERDEIETYYQPIVSATTGKTTSLEVLARWHDEKLGQVSPDEFIPIAEQTGLINQLCKQLLAKAAANATAWPDSISLSYNVSPQQLADLSLRLSILSILSSAGLKPSRLTLEITETSLAKDREKACTILGGLRECGIRIAVDDFGTGYASFAHLDRLPVDILKVDRIFLENVGEEEKRAAIVTAIVAMSKTLQLATVAEGIESDEQRAFAEAVGFDALQGHLAGKPMRAEKVMDFLEAQTAPIKPAPDTVTAMA